MIDLEKYKRLRDRANRAKTEHDRAEGALAQQMEKLRELGCDSIEAGEVKLKELEGEEKESEAAYEKELAQFEGKWGELI